MTDPSGFRGYSLLLTTGTMHIPSSGYFDLRHVASELAYQLQLHGRALILEDLTKITKDLIAWAEAPTQPWTLAHQDATITVRLTEKFTGWGPDGKPQ